MDKEEIEYWRKAGKIAAQALDFVIKEIRPKIKLIEIARKIETFINNKGASLAFPVNLSLNNIAAHYSPDLNDETIFNEEDLLKVDIGVSIEGFISDTAITLYFGNDINKKNLVLSSFNALKKSSTKIFPNKEIKELGETIEKEINALGFNVIRNLGGHRIYRGVLHGSFIPNYPSEGVFPAEGALAIEPFSTNGEGVVVESDIEQIFSLKKFSKVRDQNAQKVINYIFEKHGNLPFSKREIVEKFGSNGIIALKILKMNDLIESYPALKERSNGMVAQFEHTFLLHDNEVEITTLRENENFL
ncbi:MAG: type II methionyl aminopeptidase [Candidatus Rehaiarchaeum fermentans]|nr:type II methionyl aminopeptidase [Candidatus Rehaiarchaeum fermentans]MCW1302466.1 type II methionyl aminopeptidase [Candidatus Rehaiarchaeum fermentans]